MIYAERKKFISHFANEQTGKRTAAKQCCIIHEKSRASTILKKLLLEVYRRTKNHVEDPNCH